MTLSGIITPAGVNAEFDAGRTNLDTSAALAGRKVPMRARWLSVDSGDNMRDRSLYFKVADLYRVTGMRTSITGHTSVTITTTVKLEAILQDGLDTNVDSDALGERSDLQIEKETTNNTEVYDTLDLSSGRPFYLRPGVQYRLSAEVNSASAAERVAVMLITQAWRRKK